MAHVKGKKSLPGSQERYLVSGGREQPPEVAIVGRCDVVIDPIDNHRGIGNAPSRLIIHYRSLHTFVDLQSYNKLEKCKTVMRSVNNIDW